MVKSSASHALKLMLLLAVLMLMNSVEAKKIQPLNKRVVRIQNDLKGNGSSLMVHCKSKKDDVGEHDLANGEYFEWEFHEHMFGQTTYMCDIKWNQTAKNIDAYKTKRDKNRCKLQCWWSIRLDGGYRFNEKKKDYEVLYPWKS